MCAHNHSKGDAADPVDDHVSATVLWRTADALLDVPVAMQPGPPGNSETSENAEDLAQAVPDLLRHGGRAPRQALAERSQPVRWER